MLYNGKILQNIDFAGDFRKDKWKIVKILSYLGFFEALIESMNLDDALERFKKDLYDPVNDMKSEDYDEKLLEIESPLKKNKPKSIPKKETEAQKQKRLEAEEKQYAKDKELHDKIEKAQLRRKSIEMAKLEKRYEDNQRESFIKNSYMDVEREDNVKSPLKKMNTYHLM